MGPGDPAWRSRLWLLELSDGEAPPQMGESVGLVHDGSGLPKATIQVGLGSGRARRLELYKFRDQFQGAMKRHEEMLHAIQGTLADDGGCTMGRRLGTFGRLGLHGPFGDRSAGTAGDPHWDEECQRAADCGDSAAQRKFGWAYIKSRLRVDLECPGTRMHKPGIPCLQICDFGDRCRFNHDAALQLAAGMDREIWRATACKYCHLCARLGFRTRAQRRMCGVEGCVRRMHAEDMEDIAWRIKMENMVDELVGSEYPPPG